MKIKRIVLTGLGALAIAGIALLGQLGTSVKAQAPANQVVFASDRSGNYEIYLLDPATGLTTQLTNDPASDIEPQWSPDGTLIAFASDRDGDYELYVMRADGTDVRQLTNNNAEDRQPRWQPDRQNLVFVSNINNQWDMYIISADGAIVRQLTNDRADERGPGYAAEALQPGTGGVPSATPTPFVQQPQIVTNAFVESYELNVRRNPGEGSRILEVIARDTPVTVKGRYYDNSWVQIQTPSGTIGWVAARLLRITVDLATIPVVEASFISPPPTPTPTPAITATPQVIILFWASNGTINEGDCVTIGWDVEGIKEVYYEDAGVTGHETRQECPTATTTYHLRVIRYNDSVVDRYITITVNPIP